MWSCSTAVSLKTEIVWILTRLQFPDDAVVNKTLSILEKNGIGMRSFIQTDQKNCGAGADAGEKTKVKRFWRFK